MLIAFLPFLGVPTRPVAVLDATSANVSTGGDSGGEDSKMTLSLGQKDSFEHEINETLVEIQACGTATVTGVKDIGWLALMRVESGEEEARSYSEMTPSTT